jgi:hypothetical protein
MADTILQLRDAQFSNIARDASPSPNGWIITKVEMCPTRFNEREKEKEQEQKS